MTPNDSDLEIDFEHLDKYVGGDIALTKEIFSLFKNQVEMWGRMLTADGDDDTWASVTHSLKGTARAVGAMNLAQMCEDAEQLVGENNRILRREKMVQDIEFKMERSVIEIQRWEYAQKLAEIRGTTL